MNPARPNAVAGGTGAAGNAPLFQHHLDRTFNSRSGKIPAQFLTVHGEHVSPR
jgi:hypothetical protein